MLPPEDTTAPVRTDHAALAVGSRDVALSASLRERLTDAAYPLFAKRGIRDVSLEEIERAAGVASEHCGVAYSTRDDAAADFLARREREWTIGTIEAGARTRGATPEERLLAIVDVFDDWFHRDDFEACSFINVMIEMGAAHPLGQASIEHLAHIRQIVTTLAEEADLRDPAKFARSWHILMKGSIISATEGDAHAARRAQCMARALIREHAETLNPSPHGPALSGDPESSGDETGADWMDWDEAIGLPSGAAPATPRSVSQPATPPEGAEVAFDFDFDLV